MLQKLRMSVLVGVVVGTMATRSMPAHADAAPIRREAAPDIFPPGSPTAHQPPPSTAAPRLTAPQLERFAELLGEPGAVVWQNLLADPSLVPYAAAAAELREERKSSGRTMTIVGFSILAVGGIAGYVIMVEGLAQSMNCSFSSDYSYSYSGNSCNNGDNTVWVGLLIGLASVGVGLGVGIPGIVRLVRQTPEETDAVNRYQYSTSMRGMPLPSPYGPPPSPYGRPYPYPPTSLGKTLHVPLLSLSF
jgi:hypothetical protein